MAKKKRWIQSAKKSMKRRGTEGAFSAKAKRAGMSTSAYANKVLKNKSRYSATTRKQAGLAKAFKTARKGKKK